MKFLYDIVEPEDVDTRFYGILSLERLQICKLAIMRRLWSEREKRSSKLNRRFLGKRKPAAESLD